ncbi:MAG: winged helix-turn-helix transcriptional regulator [Leptospiraceae bacterium]|nr:winged helix-turn-helix transcriptional regulator [Leptospiraceae bacterium]
MGAVHRGSMDMIRDSLPGKDRHSALALSILKFVDKQPGISQGELGRILRRDAMTMSQAVRALQSAGLVLSQADSEDKRVKRLNTTRKGKTLSGAIKSSENKILSGLSRSWGKNRMNQFARDMAEFNEYLSSFSN